MTVSKKIYTKKKIKYNYVAAIIVILIGAAFTVFEIGGSPFAGFPSLGIWIMYTGGIIAIIASINLFSRKERIVDERMEHIGYKASRVTTLTLILLLFTTMIVDGIYTIELPYYLYASFLVCFYIASYLISYKLIERQS
jgi:drug/metabolite transporter (DMT)-like permease